MLYKYNRDREAVRLAQVIEKARNDGIFIICSCQNFFDAFTGEIEDWVFNFRVWASKTLLDTNPVEQWTLGVVRLLEEGFSIAWAGSRGFSAACSKAAEGGDAPELLLDGNLTKRLERSYKGQPTLRMVSPSLAELGRKLVKLRDSARSLKTESSDQLFAELSALSVILTYEEMDVTTARRILVGSRISQQTGKQCCECSPPVRNH